MRITRKVAPGQKGATRLLDQYGAKLLCVGYRYDSEQRKRFKTIELIIEESPWAPHERISSYTVVGVRVAFKEVELQRQVKQAGGKWNPARRLWEMRYDKALALDLKDRIDAPKISDTENRKSF